MQNLYILPKGFLSNGLFCGLKASGKKDLGLLYSESPCTVAGVFTTNSVKAHCVIDNQETLKHNQFVQAILVNSGNANACTGEIGLKALNEVKEDCGQNLNLHRSAVLTASTGIIGVPLPADIIISALSQLKAGLNSSAENFASAILTTDLKVKLSEVQIGKAKILGITKGSGMIHPQMATMLAFIVTDLEISPSDLKEALNEANAQSFNQISVDGDTSTNDMVVVLANGASGEQISLSEFKKALNQVCIDLAKQIVLDGEGANKIFEVKVIGHQLAPQIARGIISSSLVKAAIFGCDPNWGRVLATAGQYAVINPAKATLKIFEHFLLKEGQVQNFDKKQISDLMKENKEIFIELTLGEACLGEGIAWGCDLSYEYVRINAEYTT